MKKKKIRLHPALVFLILTIGIMIISSIGSILNLETSYYVVNEATGDLNSQVVNINNLFNRTGLQYLISNMLNNFLNFAPLGNLIIGLLGVGVAYKSGFLNSLFKMISEKVPRKFLTFLVVLLGIIFSMFYEVGYVILIPLAAILFMNLGRHPSAGICAAFSGITFGYGANVIINRLDSMLTLYSGKASKVLDSAYNVNLYGNGYIEDILGEYKFKISPLSFYQVNPIQAEKLYNIGVEAAKITSNDTVFDLYCGIGTISLFMAKYAKKVYGVEIVEQAIENAKENAILNNINNVDFIAGDTEVVLDDLINNKKIIPDVVMVDPPRKGLDNRSIDNILKIKPDRVVYISCNPATLVRDLAKFEENYVIEEIRPVDMFPFTKHVECVCLLELR